MEARWQRIWHTSWSASHFGKLVLGTSLGSMIKLVVGSRKGHMCGGVGKERREGDLDRPVANSRPPHLPFGPSGPLWSVGDVEFLSAWIIFVFQEEALLQMTLRPAGVYGFGQNVQSFPPFCSPKYVYEQIFGTKSCIEPPSNPLEITITEEKLITNVHNWV